MSKQADEHLYQKLHVFSGNIFIYHAFDIGEDADIEKIQHSGVLKTYPQMPPKYFKNYHMPLSVELPHPHTTSRCISVKIHSFATVSLTYKIPFESTLRKLREDLPTLDDKFQEQSMNDIISVFEKVKPYIAKPKFFNTHSAYLVIQVDTDPNFGPTELKDTYGSDIASTLRFETEILSEYQKNEMLESSIGYFRGDLTVVDSDAAFLYDADYEDTLSFFEFANIEQLELRFFDRLLDQQLNVIYEGKTRKVPIKSFLPFIGTLSTGPVDELSKLKVDISVITERLENSIKTINEPFFIELYDLLVDKLSIDDWREMIEKKLTIIHDVRSVLQHKIDAVREDMLTGEIIILIIVELIVATVI